MQLLNLVEATLESLIKFSSIRLFSFQKLENKPSYTPQFSVCFYFFKY
jgi:hypothetical protein